jgi:hypothetical protein
LTLEEEIYDQLNLISGASKTEILFYVEEIMKLFDEYYNIRKKQEENKDLNEFVGLFK